MRTLVSVSDDPTEWFEKLDPQGLRLLISQIRQCAIFIPSSSGKKTLRKSILGLSEASRDLISELIEQVPMASVGRQVNYDTKIGLRQNELSTFDSKANEIMNISQLRSEMATTEEPSSAVFARTIGILAESADRVEIFDKYLVSSVMKNRHWALGWLLDYKDLQVSLVSEVSKSTREIWDLNSTSNLEWENRISEIRDSWGKLLNLHRSSKSDQGLSSIHLIKAEQGALRNRFMIFYFSENQPISLTMSHGLEDLSRPKMREETQFALEWKADKVTSIPISWQSDKNAKALATLTWRGSKLQSISSKEFPAIQTD